MRLVAGAMLVAMAGCATAAEQVPVRGGGACDASKARVLIGKARSQKLGADALRRTGARTLRWIAPGTMVTMDYREDRLNLHLDKNGRVTKVKCG